MVLTTKTFNLIEANHFLSTRIAIIDEKVVLQDLFISQNEERLD